MTDPPVVYALALHASDAITMAHRGQVALKDLRDPIDLYAITLPRLARQYVIDPVCQMQVDSQAAGGTVVLRGRQWWFCSSDCARRFEDNPDAFLVQLPTT